MEELEVGTYNLSVAAVKNRPDGVFVDIARFFARGGHVLCIQEAGQARAILDRCEKELGVRVHYGNEDAAGSTPIMWKRGLGVFARHSYLLTSRTNTGEANAAGPVTVKSKYLNTISFHRGGRRVNVANIHTTPSIWAPKHRKLNQEQVFKAARIINHLEGLTILGGDFNQSRASRLLKPLQRGMISTQRKFGKAGTHGRRDIDDLYYDYSTYWWARSRSLHDGVSDHMMYTVTWAIRPVKRVR